jgi:hypothetical protein
MPLLLEKAAYRKRTRTYQRHNRTLLITTIVIGSIIIVGAILLASMDDYKWLIEEKTPPAQSDSIHL